MHKYIDIEANVYKFSLLPETKTIFGIPSNEKNTLPVLETRIPRRSFRIALAWCLPFIRYVYYVIR